MMNDNSGQSQSSGYANPNPQRGYTSGYSSNPWASQPSQAPASPAYGTEFAHTHTHDHDPFVAASSKVAIDIETISLNYREIRDASNDINTPKDTVEFRAALRKKIDDSAVVGKRIQSEIRQLSSIQTGSIQERKANKAKVEKMDASFTSFFNQQYAQCVRQVEEQMKRYTPRTATSVITPSGPSMMGQGGQGQYYAGHHDEEDERAGLIEAARQQEYAQLSNDVESQNAMIQYRDQAIRSLQRDMSEVNDMFKDLAALVSSQDPMLEDIASNVSSASNDVNTALSEVNKAHEIQKKSRSKLCIIAVIITVIVAIAVLITVVVIMTKK
jgi:syntaxin 7